MGSIPVRVTKSKSSEIALCAVSELLFYTNVKAKKAEISRDKMNNCESRLSDKLSRMDIVMESECTKKQAYDFWHDFFGPHFVECYVIKNGVCVARTRIDVQIE